MTYRKKLIEVALPLDAINKASAREKSIRHGHPSTLHLWWARRPLAAARAVIFSQMVDDPSAHPDLFPTEEAQEQERQRLFRLIEELVKWENTTNEDVLNQARGEIWKSWRLTCAENRDHPRAAELFDPDRLPAFHDPFAGGGSLPLEAQRLGLEAYASDLNPVAVLINKAMIEIPPKFAGMPPVNPEARRGMFFGQDLHDSQDEKANPVHPVNPVKQSLWRGAQGLAEDVRYYGRWMRDEAEKRIGHLYPKVEVTPEMARERPDLRPHVGRRLTVIAWLWARTVRSPNPAFAHVEVPLAASFVLSAKPGKEAYVEPVIESGSYRFTVKVGKPPESAKNGTKLAAGASFRCLLSSVPIAPGYIRSEAQAGRMGERLMAIIAEGDRGRIYFGPISEVEAIAKSAQPKWRPDLKVPTPCHDVDRLPMYGMPTWGDAFEPRQVVALTTFADLVEEACTRVRRDATTAHVVDDTERDAGGAWASAYAEAVATYLGLAVGRSANYWSSFTPWAGEFIVQTFGRQAIPMVWDHAEANPFSNSTGQWLGAIEWITAVLTTATAPASVGHAFQRDAQFQSLGGSKIVSTDPPYYDNIGYAELSDFFYVWLRRALQSALPSLFATVATPKQAELIASPYRHSSKRIAEAFFLQGMTVAMQQIANQAHAGFPVTIYYAFKQAETGHEGTVSTGWETFLDAVVRSGLSLTGTWPIRTERDQGLKTGTNVLASSIVLVCRPRPADAPTTTRREFLAALRAELPAALAHLQRGSIAPVDLAQAAIGPGMAVFTRYARVLDASGSEMTVREALTLINQTLDEVLAEQEGDFDADTRWALAWFEQSGFAEGEFGVAETLSKAKNTSVSGMVDAGLLASRGGRVRLLKPAELPADWDPAKDRRLTVWEMVHHLIRALDRGGERAAADLAAALGSRAESARELAYRLYVICERRKRAQEALAYNALVQSWPEIARLAQASKPQQERLL